MSDSKPKWEKTGTNTGKLTFEISPALIEKGLDMAFQRNKKNINAPGFRKGKMTREVFDKMYGEQALYQDGLNVVLPSAYERAVKEVGIEPVGQPEIKVISMEKGKPWELEAEVAVKPEVELGKYEGVSIPQQNVKVTNQEVEDQLKKLQQSQIELVLKDKPAKKGDTAVIDFEGFKDGKPFEGGKANNYSLELGSGSFIPGFEEQLIGHKAGDDVDVKVTFPKDYQQKDLAGKPVTFKVKVHEVKEKEVPKLDDEFAKDVDPKVKTLAALKKKIKDSLTKQKEEAASIALENAAIEKVVDNAKIKEIPESMIKQDVKQQVDQYLASIQQQGLNPDMYFKLTNSKPEDLNKRFESGAKQRVKTKLVLEAIVKKEKLTATKEEIDQEVDKLAKQFNMKPAEVKQRVSMELLEHDIAIRKAVQLIDDKAKKITTPKPKAADTKTAETKASKTASKKNTNKKES